MAKTRSMEPEVAAKIEALNKEVNDSAEEIIFKVFPRKVELTSLVESANDEKSPYNRSLLYHTTDTTVYPPIEVDGPKPDTKKRKLSEDTFSTPTSSNSWNARFTQKVLSNKHVNQDKVKLWVSLAMPKIEDGDNFGVQIQEEVLSELHRSQESGYNLRDNARTSYLQRAKICSKLVKYPNIEDYAMALKEHDAKQLYMARQHLVDIKNIYAVLTDVIHKNIQKIRSPRGNNRTSLY
ncbi:hypothetical protein Clacol_004019 [Clathrus columnatus]|uniref:Proteasome activator PA28 C-terminal domain-containing protein n=1 Tax=Clathrus columnatus TaxID=1419009 RepID=A0AAV5A683_9AGAM|nr:hypothetical protein Clacol_004019 [Clathrus columnatus]